MSMNHMKILTAQSPTSANNSGTFMSKIRFK